MCEVLHSFAGLRTANLSPPIEINDQPVQGGDHAAQNTDTMDRGGGGSTDVAVRRRIETGFDRGGQRFGTVFGHQNDADGSGDEGYRAHWAHGPRTAIRRRRGLAGGCLRWRDVLADRDPLRPLA